MARGVFFSKLRQYTLKHPLCSQMGPLVNNSTDASTMPFLAFEHAARRLGSASSGLDARAPGLPLAQGRSRGRSKTPAVHPTPRGLSCTRQRLAAPGPVVKKWPKETLVEPLCCLQKAPGRGMVSAFHRSLRQGRSAGAMQGGPARARGGTPFTIQVIARRCARLVAIDR